MAVGTICFACNSIVRVFRTLHLQLQLMLFVFQEIQFIFGIINSDIKTFVTLKFSIKSFKINIYLSAHPTLCLSIHRFIYLLIRPSSLSITSPWSRGLTHGALNLY